MLGDVSLTVLVLLALAALTAGFVDAVVGGGGLVQIPALLLGLPAASPVEVLATNKASAVWGTAASSATYVRRVRPDRATFVPLMLAAFTGSVLGALVATRISKEAFTPVVLLALLLVGAYVLLRPDLGTVTELRFAGRHHTLAAVGTGLAVGFYDGVLGPGTGSFFVIALVGLIGFDFLRASAQSKIANVATNLAALVVFVPMGAVLWPVAAVMAVANVLGGWLGARTAISRGSRFVRLFFLLVVGAFVVRLGGEVLGLF